MSHTANGAAASATLVASFGYHDVTDDLGSSGFQRNGAVPYKLGVQAFSDHLDRIAGANATPVRVDEIDLTRPGRHLLLTFDDGGKSALSVGDELSRRGWKGHFFITTSLIGTRTFLTASEIRQLSDAGHIVGSHSHTHPDIYRDLAPDRMAVEWRQSCDILDQILGKQCQAGAVPGGDISAAVLRSAGVSGLRYLFTSEPCLGPRIVAGCWVLGRYCAKASTSAEEIEMLANFQGWTSKLLVRRLKGLVRHSVPFLYRVYVKRSTREWQGQSL
jgi:peptidoglycan/xylan/chitin deacetylase (PgdA/CDA1 family)